MMIPSVQQLITYFELNQLVGLDKSVIHVEDIEQWVLNESLPSDGDVSGKVIGQSEQGRDIYKFQLGRGKKTILCWSQMHGDEPTATAALLDIIAFVKNNLTLSWVSDLLCNTTIHFIPMLNPDGAQAVTRENAYGIDINRDASARQSVEAQLLRTQIERISPDYAFNLHDQSRYYAQAGSKKSVNLAFMAPPGDETEQLTESRKKAMGLIGKLYHDITDHALGNVARYVDPFSPRAFGDICSQHGIATVLIESGYHTNDPHRQVARKLNFISLLRGFVSISQDEAKMLDHQAYFDVPLNVENGLTDLLISHLYVVGEKNSFHVDISIKKTNSHPPLIDQIGDLSHLGGFESFDARGFHFQCGQSFEVTESIDLTIETYKKLISQGFCRFSGDISLINNLSPWPIVRSTAQNSPADFWRSAIAPSWLMADHHGVVKAALLDGQLIHL